MAGIQAMATSLKMVKSGSEPDDLVIAHITSIGEQALSIPQIVLRNISKAQKMLER